MNPIIFPYRIGSQSAKALAKALNTKCVRAKGTYKNRKNDLVINWGSSQAPIWNKPGIKVLNHWNNVAISHNKLTALNKLSAGKVNTVEFTTDINKAKSWIKEGNIVMCRTQLTNHSGYGIVISKTEKELVNAPLYTKYVKGDEYRIHVFKHGNEYTVFDEQQKKKRNDFDGEISPLVRSHHRGFVFARESVKVPESVRIEAIKALQVLDLNFGGVDIKYNNHYKKAFVLEVNSSVGIEGQTLTNYVNEILIDCRQNKP